MAAPLESLAAKPQQTTTDEVFDTLYKAVISLDLPPGTKVSEAEIASQLGVSRQPVRDAFYRLSKMGLLLVRPQRATLVTKISEEAVFNAAFVRTALEVECLRTAYTLHADELVVSLTRNFAEQTQVLNNDDPANFHRLDEEMHKLFCECAEQRHVWNLIQEQKAHLDRVRYLTLSQSHRRNVLDEHRCILSALEAGEIQKAERKLRDHLGGVARHIDRIRNTHPDFFEQKN